MRVFTLKYTCNVSICQLGSCMRDGSVHVDGREASMRKGAAHSAGEGETGVEGDAAERWLWCWCYRRGCCSFDLRLQLIELRTRLLHCSAHRIGVVAMLDGSKGSVWQQLWLDKNRSEWSVQR